MTRLFPTASMAALVLSGLFSCSDQSGGLQASGTLEAVQVRLSARVSGEVLSVDVEEGETVQTGDPMLRIDDTAAALRVEQARGGRDMAAAALNVLVEGARSEDLNQARDSLSAAEENLRMAIDEANRLRALSDSGSVSQQSLDRAESAERQARTARSQAMSALDKLERGPRDAEIEQARAALNQAEAALALAELNLQYTHVAAPADGTVLYRMAEPGELAAAGSVLFVLADLSHLKLTVYVPETELVNLSVGQEARISVDGSDRPASGFVSWISPQAEFTPRNVQTRDERIKQVFAVRIDVDNPDGFLKPGLPADAEFPVP